MSVLGELQPNKVFKYFEEICSIPHGSRNLQQISDYLVDFAKAHELKYRQDEDHSSGTYGHGCSQRSRLR